MISPDGFDWPGDSFWKKLEISVGLSDLDSFAGGVTAIEADGDAESSAGDPVVAAFELEAPLV